MRKLVACAFIVVASALAYAEAVWTDKEITAMAAIAPHELNRYADCFDREADRLGAGASFESVKQVADRACTTEARVLRDALTREGMAPARADVFISGFGRYRPGVSR
jgi:hypothetical protein